MKEAILEQAVCALSALPFVKGVVLGGSRANGTETAGSDADIGVYYDGAEFDLAALNEAARRLDSLHRENLVCGEGGWGNWVNCGGWLTMQETPVDLICREMGRVEQLVQECERGVFAPHYQTGHPHAYISAMYRGELAESRLLFDRDGSLSALKARAEIYPEALREALAGFFGFEAGFSLGLARKYAGSGDLSYVAGHLFRAVSCINQLIFAVNRRYCLNEKRAARRAASFPICPQDYENRVNLAFAQLGNPETACTMLEELYEEASSLWKDEGRKGAPNENKNPAAQ